MSQEVTITLEMSLQVETLIMYISGYFGLPWRTLSLTPMEKMLLDSKWIFFKIQNNPYFVYD